MSVDIRNAIESDYDFIMQNVDQWWGGRAMADMLPRLFFKHFSQYSFTALEADSIVGFLVGFRSQSGSEIGYIHFAGVDPEYRDKGIAKKLYERFFDYCRGVDLKSVQCVTSPENQGSIKFHHAIGFTAHAYENDGQAGSVANYDGPGEDRVVFTKSII